MTIQEAREKKHELEKQIEDCVYYFIQDNHEDLRIDSVSIVIVDDLNSLGNVVYDVHVLAKINI